MTEAQGSPVDDTVADESDVPSPAGGRGLRTTLIAIIAVAALVVAGAAGWWIHGSDSGSTPTQPSAVDVGFARDMTVHHTQAVTMAGYARDTTSNALVHEIAVDIETEQQFQIGEMQGWLDSWGRNLTSTAPQMAWMGHPLAAGELMPGLATPSQMTQLQSSHGRQLDILFLQLMIHHHQGGIEMAQYAADNAQVPYVRQVAQSMVTQQTNEITQMEQILRQLGGVPLPPPAEH